jgi:LacI family repressor for deo operon, udp, cdd, tsx, nupC, and nupG
VGLVVPFVNRWFFAEVIGHVEDALRNSEFDLLLYNLGDATGRSRFFDVMPMRKRVDGVLVASLMLNDAEFDALTDLKRPVGLLGLERPGFVSVRIDDVAAARAAVDHMVAAGHQRIGLIGGDTDDPMAFTPPLRRRDGYRDALRAVGVEPDPQLELLGYFTVDGGRAAARKLLSLPDRPTAIFAESDEMAYGALREIRDAGLRVPQDIAVVGFDDQPLSDLFDLTSIRQPVAAQALDVTTRLLDLIEHDTEPPTGSGAVVLPTELITRGSTAQP